MIEIAWTLIYCLITVQQLKIHIFVNRFCKYNIVIAKKKRVYAITRFRNIIEQEILLRPRLQ